MSRLQTLGCSDYFRKQFANLPAELVPARVVGQHRREWDVATESETVRAVLAGKRWDPELGIEAADAQPTVGDWVTLRPGSPPVIDHILKRRTSLSRTSLAKRGVKQVLVANIDIVAVVAAFSHPGADDFAAKRSLSPRRIERYLTAIEKGGATAVVLLNKSDLDPDSARVKRELEVRLGSCPVITVSSKTEGGLLPLSDMIGVGTTVGFIGLSGVGKSSIVNRLLRRDAQKVAAERESDARGRHTTTHRELFLAEEGFILIDTPGMREFALVGAEEADLEAFTDITALSRSCQFRDCSHHDEPGCRVQAAVRSGTLEADRVESFQTLSEELRAADKKKRERSSEGRRKRPPPGDGRRKFGAQGWDDD